MFAALLCLLQLCLSLSLSDLFDYVGCCIVFVLIVLLLHACLAQIVLLSDACFCSSRSPSLLFVATRSISCLSKRAPQQMFALLIIRRDTVIIRSGLLCRNTLTSHSVCRDCGVWKTIAMKRLALPLERIWKTMEDKIECPTELDWLDLNERAQITAYTSRTPRQTPAAFNKQKHIGTNQPTPATANCVVTNRGPSWYPLASGK